MTNPAVPIRSPAAPCQERHTDGPNARDDLVGADRELELLRELIQAASNGPELEPLAAAVAAIITEATCTDVCLVHVLDDTGRSLTLAGATPPFDREAGQVQLPLGSAVCDRGFSTTSASRADWPASPARSRRSTWMWN